jgi:hypothetical protein
MIIWALLNKIFTNQLRVSASNRLPVKNTSFTARVKAGSYLSGK